MKREIKQGSENFLCRYRSMIALLAVCAAAAVLTGAAYLCTADTAAQHEKGETEQALLNIFPEGADLTFRELDITEEMEQAAKAAGGTLQRIWQINDYSVAAGRAVQVIAPGAQGDMEIMVGINGEGNITGLVVLHHEETLFLGETVMKDCLTDSGIGVLSQFIGKNAAEIEKTTDTVFGASTTVRGVVSCICAALAAAGAEA